jgi:hypothetical protein
LVVYDLLGRQVTVLGKERNSPKCYRAGSTAAG